MIMEGDPFVLIEGMTIAGIAVGATKGYVYIRSEYPHAIAAMEAAIAAARRGGMLGASIAGFALRLRHRGARRRRRLCLRRGDLAARKPRRQARHRARQAAAAGASRACSASRPSSTTCSRSPPCRSSWPKGAALYRDFGMGRSRGTMPIQLAGNVKHGGLFETAFGITLGELVDDIGGGTAHAAGRSARCRSAGRSAPISRARCSTRRSTTRPSPRATA